MIDFPSSPVLGQYFSGGSHAWIWNGTGWERVSDTRSMASQSQIYQVGVVAPTKNDLIIILQDIAFDMNYIGGAQNGSLTNNNRTLNSTVLSSYITASTTIPRVSGKGYFEVLINNLGSANSVTIGVTTSVVRTPTQVGDGVNGWGYISDGMYYHSSGSTGHGACSTGTVVMVAVDVDGGKIWFGRNGVWNDSSNPAAGTVPAYSGLTGSIYPACTLYSTNNSATYRGDVVSQTYAPPSGFSSWG